MTRLLLLRSRPPPILGATSTADPITTADTFDLKTEEGFLWVSHRRAIRSDARLGPRFAREIDERESREFSVVVRRGLNVELWRLGDIWARSRRGTLPLSYPETVHGLGIGDLVVVIVDPDLVREYLNPEIGSFEVRLREWRG